MTEQELKRLFNKQIPKAHKSLQEAASMRESEAKLYKIERAKEVIGRGLEILERCHNELTPKQDFMLWHIADNVPKERTAHILYDSTDVKAISNLKALRHLAFKRLHKVMSSQQYAEVDLQQETRESIAERLKAREQRQKG